MTLIEFVLAIRLRTNTRRLMHRHQVVLSAALRAYRPGHI